MFALACELITPNRVVITTTTTKIILPSHSDSPYLFLSRNEKEIVDFIVGNGAKWGHVTIASEKLAPSDKLRGIDPALVSTVSRIRPVVYVIVEADGAARKSLKAPDPAFEPVIPQNTSLLVPVVAIDAVGCSLTEETVFRSELAAKMAGVDIGEAITTDIVALLVTHPSGIVRGSPANARIVPFINKMDLDAMGKARDLASKILAANHPQIDRVVLGQARLRPPVVDVVYA
jgi:probable selenium-dependent hydroxylase accessory protein YqeC